MVISEWKWLFSSFFPFFPFFLFSFFFLGRGWWRVSCSLFLLFGELGISAGRTLGKLDSALVQAISL